MQRISAVVLAVAGATMACHPSSAPSPGAAESGAYVVRLGNDTVAVDQYTRVGDRIEGTFMARSPRTVVTTYTITLAPNGMPSLYEISPRLPDGSLVPPANIRSATVTFA